jgi:hypothetical protein
MMHTLKDTLAARRAQRAQHRQLEHELAAFTSASDRIEIETIAARYSDEDSREVRQIMVALAA